MGFEDMGINTCRLVWRGHFEAAHCLHGHASCGKVHGHSYDVEVVLVGGVGRDGMVIDFGMLKDVVAQFDHMMLNEILETPTAENLASYIAGDIDRVAHISGRRISTIEVSVREGTYGGKAIIERRVKTEE